MEFFNKLLSDKFAKAALIILGVLYFVILFADFIAPYSSMYSRRDMSYVPPSKIYTIDENGKFSLPYTYNYVREYDSDLMQTVFKQDRTQKYYLKILPKGENYKLLGIIPSDRHLFGTDKGGQIYLLGTDINGRDVFSRLLFGGRIYLTIGFLSLLIVFPIGLLYGGISGYFGGITDILMMRFAEAVMAIPSFYLLNKCSKVYFNSCNSGINRLGRICTCCKRNGSFNKRRRICSGGKSYGCFKFADYFKTYTSSNNKLCNNCNDFERSFIYFS